MKYTYSLVFYFCIFASTAFGQSMNMTLLSNWTDNSLPISSGVRFNDCWGFVKGGHEYAVMGSLEKVYFFDVTVPTAPVNIATFTNGSSSLWRDFKTYGDYVYAVCDQINPASEGLVVFSIAALPSGTITQVYQNTTAFQKTHNIFVDEINGKLYAAGSNTAHMIIFDLVANPAAPTVVYSGSLSGGYVHDVHVRNNKMYCSHGGNGMYVYDVSNLAMPVLLGSNLAPNSGYNHSSWLNASGSHLIMAEETWGKPLKVLNVSDPSNMSITSTFISALIPGSFPAPYVGSIVHNPFIKGNLCFLAYYHEGIQVYNISNPAAPTKVAYYDTDLNNTNYDGYLGAWGVYPFLPSGTIVGSDVKNGLFVLSVAASVLPIEIKSFKVKNNKEKVSVTWETENEINVQSFDIQRSSNGKDFLSIHSETSRGKANRSQSYQWQDDAPLQGTSYYRLKMNENDGRFDYSKIESVVFERNNIRFYPNPVKNEISIDLGKNKIKQNDDYSVEIYDFQGKLIQTSKPILGEETIQLLIDLPNGHYSFLLKNESAIILKEIFSVLK
jgi:choice-of-anchor B domain-containing protein